jgi:hypothetical protein
VNDLYAKPSVVTTEEAARIRPRAEFRVFEHGVIKIVQEKMWGVGAVLGMARTMPMEMYLVSAREESANVKVREGLLDIKTKIGETPEGYEIFQPRGKLAFPVGKADLSTALSYLNVRTDLSSQAYTLDEVIEMARNHPDLVLVMIEKMRYGFTVDGIICECAQVRFNGALLESACCESDDYVGMRKVIKALGIEAIPNTSYPKAARRVVGIG